MRVQPESKTCYERADVNQGREGGPYEAVADACVGGTYLEVLLDTANMTYLNRDKPEILPHEDHLEASDGRETDVEGAITTI